MQANEEAGAASVMWAQRVELSRVQLLNNSASSSSGGGLSVGNTRLLTMQDVLVQGNKVGVVVGRMRYVRRSAIISSRLGSRKVDAVLHSALFSWVLQALQLWPVVKMMH
jgi:hypothetical protein